MRDLKFALRTLFRTPLVTTVAIVSLAFGIGANAAIFSLFDQVLLRPLPVRDPGRLVNLSAPGPKPGSQSCGQAGSCDDVFSYAMFRDLERQQQVFTSIAAHVGFGASLAYRGQTLAGEGMLVSGSYFPVLGVQPALGRLLSPNDDQAVGESHVVVLSHDYWRTHFGASFDVLNQTMIVNGQTMTIVGVAPMGFKGTTLGVNPEVFVPITLRALMQPGFTGFDNRRSYWAYLFARLRPGVSIAQARTALNLPYQHIITDVEAPLQKGMSDKTMVRFKAKAIVLTEGAHGQSSVPDDARTPFTLLLCVTGVVLLIACANIANLLLARSAARAGEMAVRLSIGASRRQLVGQLLVESWLLAACGGVGGLLIARWTLAFIVGSLLPADATQALSVQLDPSILLFTAALSLGTGLLFGLFPAIHSTRPDLASTLKGTAGQPSGARTAKWFRLSLATAQIALSMALLGAAGLFTKSLINVSRVDLGLKIDNLVTFSIAPNLSGYTSDRARVLFEQTEDQLAATPGVTGVTAALVPLLAGDNWGSSVSVQGFTGGPDVDSGARYNEVAAGYFRTLGIPLMSGREFTRADRLGAPKVAIVNQAFAKKFNLGHDAVGKLMAQASGNAVKLDTEIVGLVQDAKYSEVKGAVPPLFFQPYEQDKEVGNMSFYVRTALDAGQLLTTIPGVMAKLDPNLPLDNARTMPQQVRENVFLDRLISTLSAAFAVVATLLAAIGLYGVLAFTVAQRTREFGLRMALGAAPGRVRRMILGQVGWMTLIGGVVGLGVAMVLGRFAETLLFQMQGRDPIVLTAAAVILTIVSLSAGFIPALRASRLNPMRALRYE
jgi:predicted permease